MECERSAEGVQEFARRRRIVIILGDYRKIGDRQRDRRSVQDQQDQGKNERQRQRPPVSNDLSQLFTGLRNYASHFNRFQVSGVRFQDPGFSTRSNLTDTWPLTPYPCSVFLRDFSFHPLLLDAP